MTLVSSGQLTLTDLNDTKQVILYLNANYKSQIYDPTATTYSPSFTSTNLVITPELYVAGGSGANLLPSTDVKSITWYEGSQTTTAIAESTSGTATTTAGYTYTLPTGAVGTTAKPLTIKSNLNNNQKYTCVVVYTDPDTTFDVTIKSDVEIQRVSNGAKGNVGTNAITAFLTNSAVTLPATTNGTVSIFTGSSTDVYVYDGTTALTFTTGTAGNGQFNISTSISPASAVTLGTIAASGSGTARAVVPNITAFAQAQDVATVTYTITGKSLTGTAISTTVLQTFAKSKAGVDSNAYWLTLNSEVIKQDPYTSAFTPTAITATSNSQTGTSTPVKTTSMKWLIGTSTDGTTFTDGSVITATTATTSAFATNLKAVRFRMYLSTTTTPDATNFVDEQIVYVITDGQDSYYANLWAPNGDTIRNGQGTITVQADLYKGASTVTPTAYKWYYQDPSATTSLGGDADGGAGWRLMQTIADATTAPTLNGSTAGGTLAGATYYVKYTWISPEGETKASSEASLAVTANYNLKITVPSFPSGVTGAKVYVGTATGVNKYQGTITTSAGTYTITAPINTTNATPPATNTANVTNYGVTGYTSATITVGGSSIAGVEGFKCVATAPTTGNKYSGVIIVRDFQDPVSVNILGANIFKNGQGNLTLTAQLIQAGVEIPTAGYTFAWSLYGTNGAFIKTLAGSGDTITVLSTDVTGTANVICDVSK
jgi:hypothetical protein